MATKESTFEGVSDFLFHAAPIGLGITNTNGDILNVNKATQDMLGYSVDELKKINIFDLYTTPDKRQRLLDILRQDNQIRGFEATLIHKSGTHINVLINSDYIDLQDKKVLLTAILDITRYKKIQKDLTASEERYHRLFSSAPVGITVTDIQGGLTASNQAVQELLGYTAEELKTTNSIDFYLDKNERQRLLELTEKFGVVRDFETKFKSKNGDPISILINTDLIDFDDQHKMLLTSIRDISNLKQVETELRKERDFNNSILDTTASLVLVMDHTGKIIRFNKACEKATGYSAKEIKGKNLWDILDIDPMAVKKELAELVGGDYPRTYESSWAAKNGDECLISWTNTVLMGNAGYVEYIIATGIDITERRRAERELQEANQKLVVWVEELKERTREMERLSELGGQLQSCETVEEACAISVQFLQIICPESTGAIYLIRPSKDLAEAVETWGSSDVTDRFPPMNCWAIRRGHLHWVDDAHPGLICSHIKESKKGQYLCVPMTAHGESMGIIHLHHIKSEQQSCNEHKIQLISAVAEHISLTLSNLKLRETLRQQSIRDLLTGLYNRRYMEESLIRELHRADREGQTVGVLMFDIDHFKVFNDLFGHDGGDALLRELGEYLLHNIRTGDIVSRYGGEEFVAVLVNTDLETARLRADELRRGVKSLMVYHMGKPLQKCTVSIGVAVFPMHGTDFEKLIKSADDALYLAKNSGRDRVVVASADQ